VIARYEYDGANRRVKKCFDADAPADPNGIDSYRHFYYNAAWQVVETRLSSSENTDPNTLDPEYQYVWSMRYIDAPILRDENKDGDGDCVDGDDERIYYITDANMNVTALTDVNNVLERYVYDAYGNATVLDADFSADADGVSDYANPIRFAGYWRDRETGLHCVRNRYYHARLGRWVQRDTLGYVDGISVYQYAVSNPVLFLDWLGLDSVAIYDCEDEGGPKPKTPFALPRPSDRDDYARAADDFDHAIGVSSGRDALAELRKLQDKVVIDELHVFDHGAPGMQQFGDQPLGPWAPIWAKMASTVLPDGMIYLHGCGVANDKDFIKNMARGGKRPVTGWDGPVCYWPIPMPGIPDHYAWPFSHPFTAYPPRYPCNDKPDPDPEKEKPAEE